MNAHTPRQLDAISASDASPLAAACPVARLGRRFNLLQNTDRELANGETPQDRLELINQQRFGIQLMAASEAISAQAEWVRPQSLEGVYFQMLHLGSLMRELAEEGIGSTEKARLTLRFERLNHLALNGMERLGGFDGADYGKNHKTLFMTGFEYALELTAD